MGLCPPSLNSTEMSMGPCGSRRIRHREGCGGAAGEGGGAVVAAREAGGAGHEVAAEVGCGGDDTMWWGGDARQPSGVAWGKVAMWGGEGEARRPCGEEAQLWLAGGVGPWRFQGKAEVAAVARRIGAAA